MNAVLVNWKTSLAGLLAGLGSVLYIIVDAAQKGQFNGQTGVTLVMGVGVCVIGALAKDGDIKVPGLTPDNIGAIVNGIATHQDIGTVVAGALLKALNPANLEAVKDVVAGPVFVGDALAKIPAQHVADVIGAYSEDLPPALKGGSDPNGSVGGSVPDMQERYDVAQAAAGVAVNAAPGKAVTVGPCGSRPIW